MTMKTTPTKSYFFHFDSWTLALTQSARRDQPRSDEMFLFCNVPASSGMSWQSTCAR